MPKYRIGIDVGGTFTHAVAIDNCDFHLAGQVKVPTTHSGPHGVADGIIDSLQTLLKECSINPDDVIFIAHSTTQATNALLEGDVSAVGVIAAGKGIEGKRVRGEAGIGDVDLGDGKKIRIISEYLEIDRGVLQYAHTKIQKIIDEYVNKGVKAIVAAEAFSVDDPANEDAIVEAALKSGLSAAATHEISGLYGLRMRTRTAVINASIMPRMIETARATEECVKRSGIKAPLMIMRSDGGVMSIEAMKRRPILTILSGPAAGVASALLYVKVSDGIFLEVGGTSTDIAVIRDGKALVRSAEIGGHKLFLRTIDSRTVGVAGGSLPIISGNKIVDVGPRSAHIAGLKYASFSNVNELVNGKFAVTPTCAANVLGLVRKEDWAYGNKDAAEEGIRLFGSKLGGAQDLAPQQIANSILKIASQKIIKTINSLIKDYKLEKDSIALIGGGGGAAAIVPFVASEMKMGYKIAENHAVLSAIGAALAFVTDTVEKSAVDPSREDVLKVRREAEESVRKMGADPGTIEVSVEIDRRKNVIRAVASGATEMRRKDLCVKEISVEERKETAASSMKVLSHSLALSGFTDWYEVWTAEKEKTSFLGLIRSKTSMMRVIDRQGIIRLQKNNALVIGAAGLKEASDAMTSALEKYTVYGDAGEKIPSVTVLKGSRIIDMSGMTAKEQVLGLFEIEMKNTAENERIVIILSL